MDIINGVEQGDSGVSVSNTAYDATSWDNNTDAPTKNAIRDKFESMSVGVGISLGLVLALS